MNLCIVIWNSSKLNICVIIWVGSVFIRPITISVAIPNAPVPEPNDILNCDSLWICCVIDMSVVRNNSSTELNLKRIRRELLLIYNIKSKSQTRFISLKIILIILLQSCPCAINITIRNLPHWDTSININTAIALRIYRDITEDLSRCSLCCNRTEEYIIRSNL